MKNFTKFLGIAAFVAVIGFLMAACSNGGGGGGRPGNPAANTKFNLVGAKAILVSEGGSGGGRAAYQDGNTLFKILENNSIEPIIDLSSKEYISNPRIRFIARSPVESKKDLYVCFDNDWWIWDSKINDSVVDMGSFIHIKEDGSVVNIVASSGGSSWSYVTYDNGGNSVAFDGSGNMFFTVSESSGSSSTNVIYKYNPVTGAKQQLTAAINNIWYQQLEISADGNFVIAKGNRWNNNTNVDFLRYIPTANPDNADYIYYRSNGGGYINSFALSPQSKELFVSGQGIYENNNNWDAGVYKISFGSPSKDDWKWTKLSDGYEQVGSDYYYFYYIKSIFVASDNSVWGLQNQNAPRFFGQLINSSGDKEFKIPQSLKDRFIVSAKPSASYFYFSADITTGSQETGYHNIYRFSTNNPENVQNLFDNIPNKNNIEVVSFDIGGGYLYFGGAQGLNLLTGKINLSTLEYTQLEFGQKITTIVVY